MKSLIAVLVTLVSLSARAEDDEIKYLTCQDGNFSWISAELDSRAFIKGSGYADVTNIRLHHQFSSVLGMVCEGTVHNTAFDVNCVGYYSMREITEVKFRNEGDKIVALWKLSEVYGGDDMKSKCQVSDTPIR